MHRRGREIEVEDWQQRKEGGGKESRAGDGSRGRCCRYGFLVSSGSREKGDTHTHRTGLDWTGLALRYRIRLGREVCVPAS